MNRGRHAVNITRVGGGRVEWTFYHARHNITLPASQLVCLPDYQAGCLITWPHTEHLLSTQKAHGWGRAETLFLFTRIHFEKVLNLFTQNCHHLSPIIVQPFCPLAGRPYLPKQTSTCCFGAVPSLEKVLAEFLFPLAGKILISLWCQCGKVEVRSLFILEQSL